MFSTPGFVPRPAQPSFSLHLDLPGSVLAQQVLGPLLANVPLGPLLSSSGLISKCANSEVTSTTKAKTGHQRGHHCLDPPFAPAFTEPIWGQYNLLRSQNCLPLTELTAAPMYPHPRVLLVSPGIPQLQLLYSPQRRKMKGFLKREVGAKA